MIQNTIFKSISKELVNVHFLFFTHGRTINYNFLKNSKKKSNNFFRIFCYHALIDFKFHVKKLKNLKVKSKLKNNVKSRKKSMQN